MDRWDVIVILVAGYVSVMALVRLMARRRNQLIEHFRDEIEKQVQAKTDDQQEDRDAA